MTQKQWQVSFYVSEEQETPQIFYDETLAGIYTQVSSWLLSTCPIYLKSGEIIYTKHGKGWDCPGSHYFTVSSSQQAYKIFCDQVLDFQKGPQYEECGFIDGKFRLEYVKKTLQCDDPKEVNRMLQRGWHLIAFQNSYQASDSSYYILGHIEQYAF